jgi:ABC-type uncharacterized transport system ATPase subunit
MSLRLSLLDEYLGAVRLSGNDVLSDQNINVGFFPEEELYKSLEEIEADTIGDLLPTKMICFLVSLML